MGAEKFTVAKIAATGQRWYTNAHAQNQLVPKLGEDKMRPKTGKKRKKRRDLTAKGRSTTSLTTLFIRGMTSI